MVSLALRNRLKNPQFCVTTDFFVCEQSIEQYGQDSSSWLIFFTNFVLCMYIVFRKGQKIETGILATVDKARKLVFMQNVLNVFHRLSNFQKAKKISDSSSLLLNFYRGCAKTKEMTVCVGQNK